MKRKEKSTPEGTRDLLYNEYSTLKEVETRLGKLFGRLGYSEVVTPTVEYYDMFVQEISGMPQETLYKLTDHRGRLLVLRPDMTMPIARMVGSRMKEAVLPIRVCYTQNIFRIHPAMTGKSNEIVQSGVELIGASGKRADLEIITTAMEALRECGMRNFRLELGHAGFFKALAASLDTDEETCEDIRLSVESKNYTALSGLLDSLEDSIAVRVLRKLPGLFGGSEVFSKAHALCEGDERLRAPLYYLEEIYRDLSAFGRGETIVDLGLVHRNDYYTGVVFRGYIEGSGMIAISGGRYDNLLEHYGISLPATGFAVENETLARTLTVQGESLEMPPLDAMVYAAEGYEMKGIHTLRQLTREGGRYEYATCDTASQAKQLAQSRGARQLYIVSDRVVCRDVCRTD